jgi:hypothetical protein
MIVAYEFFNQRLFSGELPRCLITMQRKAGSLGYFDSERFKARNRDLATDEIALNARYSKNQTDEQILGTLSMKWCISGSSGAGQKSARAIMTRRGGR